MDKNWRVFIGTPAYNSQVHLDYLATILNVRQTGLPFVHFGAGNDSHILRVRNTVLSVFYSMRESFSHLAMLDGDVGLGGADFIRLLTHEKEIVSVPVKLKGTDGSGRQFLNCGTILRKDGPLWVTDRFGTAVVLLSKCVVEALVNDAIKDGRRYKPNVLSSGSDINLDEAYDVFRSGVIEGEYKTEDYWVSWVLRKMGYEIFVDPGVVTTHHGQAEYKTEKEV